MWKITILCQKIIFFPILGGARAGCAPRWIRPWLTPLIEFVDDITRNIDAGKQTDCLIMDLLVHYWHNCILDNFIEYSSAVWDPHQQQDKQRLDRIQRRAARYVTNRYHNTSSVSDMLDQLEWPSLESRRTNSWLTMTKNLANVDTSDKLIPLQRSSRNCNTLAFSIPSCRTSILKESFYPRTTKDWNALNFRMPVLGHRVLKLSRLASVSKLPVPFLTSL